MHHIPPSVYSTGIAFAGASTGHKTVRQLLTEKTAIINHIISFIVHFVIDTGCRHSRKPCACKEEAAQAIQYVPENRVSLTRDDLKRETYRLFGFSQTGQSMAAYISAGIDYSILPLFGITFEDNDRIVPKQMFAPLQLEVAGARFWGHSGSAPEFHRTACAILYRCAAQIFEGHIDTINMRCLYPPAKHGGGGFFGG